MRLALFPLVGGSHEVRKALMSFWCLIPLGFSVLMIASVTKAHVGRDLDRFIYAFSQLVARVFSGLLVVSFVHSI
ncbi:hypothetical protein EDD22DRAFT_886464 [Suillus occidentalis]|nr:hypothetical protein EDD22DRAFT_886464 [Suillus occidentalis]